MYINAAIKKYNSMVYKKRKKHDKIVLLAKSKVVTTEVLISNTLIDLYISHDVFALKNNVLREYNDMKEAIILSIEKKNRQQKPKSCN